MRKSLFYALAERGWPLMGLTPLGASLEEIFITIVNKTDGPATAATGKKPRRGRTAASSEKDLAQAIIDATAEQQKMIAPYEGED
jgi:hypothetical protein